jgi:hypothetical protein
MEMKKIGRQMSVLMGLTLSFCLSLAGNLASGKFTVPGFIISFIASLVISLLIGFFVPMKKVNDSLDTKLGLQPGKTSTHAFESLISDLIYTPIITVVMVALAYKNATSHGAKGLHFGPMLAKSMVLSLVLGYILIFIFMPVFMKIVLKRNGVGGPPNRPQ